MTSNSFDQAIITDKKEVGKALQHLLPMFDISNELCAPGETAWSSLIHRRPNRKNLTTSLHQFLKGL
ncbi:hypothetical protein GX50_05814 [[Emmonsia] crescens]|uniref:Uncharacterized protein n=1 Tax=[Emmonsia] crescens TaxID=73230 RepID=A0A2B7ZBQ5_9EURO|nr:hypothetical protein GX50_05814 [Emmonsia crescens]